MSILEVIFIRHGDTDYALANKMKMNAIEENFIPLSKKGVKQVEKIATDSRLKDAELIISSPYTRALQTASIISRHTQLPLTVEFDLHEWKYDVNGTRYVEQDEIDRRISEFIQTDGDFSSDNPKPWEKKEHVRRRAISALAKYKKSSLIIAVLHGMLIHCLTGYDRIDCAEILRYPINLDKTYNQI